MTKGGISMAVRVNLTERSGYVRALRLGEWAACTEGTPREEIFTRLGFFAPEAFFTPQGVVSILAH